MVQLNALPGTLYVVATPIGNLEDVTLRALRVLREVQVIAAEDTRRTAKLLAHYSIETPTISLHEHNEKAKTPGLIERLRADESIALVSDAGTPVLSDPGGHLVTAARQAGITVLAIPGPSAVLAVVAASGYGGDGFTFLGFPPRRSNDLIKWLSERFAPPHMTAVFHEAPHRIQVTLKRMLDILGDRPIIVGRELTKLHEELVEQPISTHIERLANPRGEFTVLVPAQTARAGASHQPDEGEIKSEVGRLTKNDGLAPRAAARAVAEKYGLRANEVYRVIQRKTE